MGKPLPDVCCVTRLSAIRFAYTVRLRVRRARRHRHREFSRECADRLPQFLGPAACVYQGCASDLLDSLVGGTERKIVDAFNNDLVLIDEGGSLLMRRHVRANVYAGAHRRSFTECILSAISGTIADQQRRHPRPGRQLEAPIIVCTLNTYQDEVTANLDPAVLDRFKLVRFSPFVSENTYACYTAKLLDAHLFSVC